MATGGGDVPAGDDRQEPGRDRTDHERSDDGRDDAQRHGRRLRERRPRLARHDHPGVDDPGHEADDEAAQEPTDHDGHPHGELHDGGIGGAVGRLKRGLAGRQRGHDPVL
jgi:hypothetical protein